MTRNGIISIANPHAKPSASVIRRVAAHLQSDNLAVIPTETRYALCARGDSKTAIENARRLKGRAGTQPFSVFIDSINRLGEWKIRANSQARALIDAFWPGPLTLILPSTSRIFRYLGATQTVGVRFSPEQFIIQTVSALDAPAVATSANPSGVELTAAAENRWLENMAKEGKLLWLRPTRYTRRPVSTIVDCTGERFRILRKGSITEAQLSRALDE